MYRNRVETMSMHVPTNVTKVCADDMDLTNTILIPHIH